MTPVEETERLRELVEKYKREHPEINSLTGHEPRHDDPVVSIDPKEN